MGFFKDFKDDLSQAVNELMPEEVFDDNTEVNTLEENDMEEPALSKEVTGIEDDDNVDMELLDDILTKDESEVDNNKEEVEEKSDIAVKAEETKEKSSDAAKNDADEITVITKGTVINGNISAQGSLEVMGNIKGDIECQGKLTVIGLVTGNCLASEVYIGTERYEGNIASEGSIKIGLGTVVIGDITGTSAVVAGAVKGNIDISGPIIVDSSAVIKGDIKAQAIQINKGAVIEGFCSLSYSSINIDNIFE